MHACQEHACLKFKLSCTVYLPSLCDDRFGGIDSMTSLNNKIPRLYAWMEEGGLHYRFYFNYGPVLKD